MPRWARLAAPGRMTPLPPPTIAAIDEVWCGAQNGGTVISPRTGRQVPGDRVDRGDLDRRRRVQRRQDRRQPLGQHRLARSRRAEQGQVVPARRADLHRQPRLRLAEHLRQVQLLGQCEARAGAGPGGGSGSGGQRRRRAAAQPDDHLERGCSRRSPGRRAPGRPPRRSARRPPRCRRPAAAATTAGRTPGTGRSRPSRPSSARNIFPASAVGRHRLGGGEDGDRDGQVKARSALGQGGGREADGDLRVRPGSPRC